MLHSDPHTADTAARPGKRGVGLAGMIGQEITGAALWTPVMLSLGILIYFAADTEPSWWSVRAALASTALCILLSLLSRSHALARYGFLALCVVLMGFSVAGLRSYGLAAPVLEYRYYGPVEGRVVALDRSSAGALRVTLDRVTLGHRSARRTPAKVRLSLYGPDAEIRPKAGARVMTTAHLSPPSGPAEPGGFDFQRHAWFAQLGGVGYTRLPILLAAEPIPPGGFFGLRIALSDKVRAALPGQTGAFAAALMSGDRSALTPDTMQALRETNLAHLLAISGLHMGLLVGFVFGLVRLSMTAVPGVRSTLWGKRIAALAALAAASIYLGLSGGSVATERAFIMAAVALGAILLGRRVISLRSVAIAATALLLWQPEALTGPGFQMSFAATTALVIVFQVLARRAPKSGWRGKTWRVFEGAVVSSAVAGFATLPVAMAHFNQIAHYGLIANVVSVPLMGVWIMPLAVVAVLLMPFGLEAGPLRAMGLGLDWILSVAHEVSTWPGAVSKVTAPPMDSFALIMLGAALIAVMHTRLRMLGLIPVLIGVVGWVTVARPDVLISDTGGLVAMRTQEGLALSRAKGSGFVAGIWLENDGDPAQQWQAAERWRAGTGQSVRVPMGWGALQIARGKRGLAAFEGCSSRDVVVFTEDFDGAAPCLVLDKSALRDNGSIAIFVNDTGIEKIETARSLAGRRLWNDRGLRRAALQDRPAIF